MFHKFKITTYATLLLIGVFVLPYAGNVAEVSAENYGCKGSKKEVRQCLKAVISERDKTIVELQTRSDPRGPTDLRHPDICTTGSAEDQERCIHEMRMQVDSREKEIRTVLHGPPPPGPGQEGYIEEVYCSSRGLTSPCTREGRGVITQDEKDYRANIKRVNDCKYGRSKTPEACNCTGHLPGKGTAGADAWESCQ